MSNPFSDLEVPIRDSERIAVAIRELFLGRIAGVDLNMKDDVHNYMLETLLDRQQELTAEITRAYYKAFKSAGGDKRN